MYKILLRKSDRGLKSLYSFYTEDVVTEETEDTPASTETVIWSTEEVDKLEQKILELLNTYSREDFKVVQDASYELDIIFS